MPRSPDPANPRPERWATRGPDRRKLLRRLEWELAAGWSTVTPLAPATRPLVPGPTSGATRVIVRPHYAARGSLRAVS